MILAGDFHVEPSELVDFGWPQRNGLQVVHPSGGTVSCSSGKGRLIDFFLVSHELVPLVESSVIVDNVPWGPHAGVTLVLRARPRQLELRTLRLPRALPLPSRQRLPFDQVRWQQCLQQAQ